MSFLMKACATALISSTVTVIAVAAAGPPARPQPTKPSAAQPKMPPTPPPARCSAQSGEPIPAEKILLDLKEGKNVELLGRTIEGSLDADAYWPAAGSGKSSLRVIRGLFKLDSCKVTGRIAFPRCVFLKDIQLPCTESSGDLDLTDSEVRGMIGAERAHITGDVRLGGASVEGSIFLRNATVQGRVDLSGSRLHVLSFKGTDLQRGIEGEHAILDILDLTSAKVAGSSRFSDVLILNSVTARDSTFAGGLLLSSIKVAGPLELGWSSMAGDFSIADASIQEDLTLPQAVEGATSLSDVDVGHNLLLLEGQFADVTIERLRVHGSTRLDGGHFSRKLVIGDAEFGRTFSAKGSVFSSECEFRKVRFPGDDPLAGAVFARAPLLVETVLPRPATVQPEPSASGPAEELDNQDP